jgi:hypothetical protein
MRWKALLQGDCWCLQRAMEGTKATVIYSKIRAICSWDSRPTPVLLPGFRSQAFPTLAPASGVSLCEMGIRCLLHWNTVKIEGSITQGTCHRDNSVH